MKNLLVKASILAVLCTLVGCAEKEDAPAENNTCTVNVCKDANTMTYCNNGVPMDVPCTLGCDSALNECKKNATCLGNVCQDANTLLQCNADGTTSAIPCANGCSNGVCNSSAGNSCTASVCQDSDTLLACANGVQTSVACPYGCEAGVCKEACTSNYCKDGATLMVCADGRSTAQACEHGCDAGACKDACTSNFCRDANNLMVCDASGNMQLVNCPLGCDAGACKTSAEGCTNGDAKCDGDTLKICMNNAWIDRECANGCANNACAGEEPECQAGAKECLDANTARTCVAGGWVSANCANGCEAGACVSAPVDKCTDGSKKCDGNAVMNCVGGEWVKGDTCSEICLNGACASAGDLPKVGDKCDANFSEVCANNVGYYCADGAVDSIECSDEAPCAVRAADTYADCAESCKAGDPAKGVCVDYMGHPLAIQYSCEATTDGGYAYFMGEDYEICEVSCVEGKCSNEQPPVSYELCDDSCQVEGGQSCSAYCAEKYGASVTCALDSDGYIECANSCSNAGDKAPVCITSQGTGYLLNQVCTDVDGKLLFLTDYSDYSACANGCNAAGTACEGGVTPGTCTEGAKQCSGKTVQVCTNGAWVDDKTCENACSAGKCTDPSVVPTVGDNCDDSLVEVCDGNTGYYCYDGKVDTIECSDERPCAVRAADNYSDCAETCKAGDPAKGECMDYYGYPLAVQFVCEKTEDGGYAYFMSENYQFCEESCSAGVCDGAEPGSCTEGAKQCSGKTVQVCTNGAWVNGETCENACSNGACTSGGDLPNVGDKCDENFAEVCDGNTAYYCAYGEVDTLSCNNERPCAVRAADNYSDCAETCKAGDPAKGMCMNYMGSSLAVKYTCEKTTAGGYAYFMSQDYEVCEVSCVDGACSNEQPALTYELCGSDCQLQGGQTCIAACQAESASSTCVLDSEGYIECSESCSSIDAKQPVCITSQGKGYLLNQICTNVDGKKLWITDYTDYSACQNGCNAAGTACK
ncbi:MAG: hypothetical protein II180_12245 [Proteobacteria bacterium]|nr:hypothetical protein [Pseudomonadota bacterium]